MKQAQNIGNVIFAAVLRREMDSREVTQEAVAAAADASQATVNGWLTGSLPRADYLYRLAKKWGVSMEYLVTGEASGADKNWMLAESPERDTAELRRLIKDLGVVARAIEQEAKKI